MWFQIVANKQPHGACTFRALTHLECINFSPSPMKFKIVQSCASGRSYQSVALLVSNHIKPNITSDSWSLGCNYTIIMTLVYCSNYDL